MHTQPPFTTQLLALPGSLSLMGGCTHSHLGNLTVDVVRDGPTTRVSLRGEADLASIPGLETALAAIEPDGAKQVDLYVTDLDFLDVAALRELTLFARRIRDGGYDLTTYGAQPMVEQLVRLTGVHDDLGLA